MEQRLEKISDAAKLAGVSKTTIQKWLDRESIKRYERFGLTVVDLDEVIAYKRTERFAGRPKKDTPRARLDPVPKPLVDDVAKLAKYLGESKGDLTARLMTEAVAAEWKRAKKK